MTKLYATTGSTRTHLIRTASLSARTPRTWCLRDMPAECGLAEYVDTMPDPCQACTSALADSLEAQQHVAAAREVLDATKPAAVTNRRNHQGDTT
jgi:hypothetical protein